MGMVAYEVSRLVTRIGDYLGTEAVDGALLGDPGHIMTFDVWDGDDESAAGRFVPLYILVNGRTSPRNTSLDLATQVIALPVDTPPARAGVPARSWTGAAAGSRSPRSAPTCTAAHHHQGDGRRAASSRVSWASARRRSEKIADRCLLESVLAGLERI